MKKEGYIMNSDVTDECSLTLDHFWHQRRRNSTETNEKVKPKIRLTSSDIYNIIPARWHDSLDPNFLLG